MKLSYQNELYELRKWIDNISSNMSMHLQFPRPQKEVKDVLRWLDKVSLGIEEEYPFYVSLLSRISIILFPLNNMGTQTLNPVAFGELVVIIRHIEAEPVATPFWATIHKRIYKTSADLYKDGHFASAADAAVKEVESRLRKKFEELKSGEAVPSKVGDIIGALFSENGAFKFCDTSTTSGKDYRRGINSLFLGIMAAYRNPSAHANLELEKREALEQIMLASQLMYILDLPNL